MKVKPIPGYKGYYADNIGNIYSAKTGELRKMTPGYSHNGYQTVMLKSPKGSHRTKVHRLIALTYKAIAEILNTSVTSIKRFIDGKKEKRPTERG